MRLTHLPQRLVARMAATAILSGPVFAQSFVFDLVGPMPSNGIEEVYLWDVNSAGEASGTSTSGPSYAGFLLTPSLEKSVVPIQWPKGLNDTGLIVGGSVVHDLATGASTVIPTISHAVQAEDVNNAGVVVGYVVTCNCSNSQALNQIPFIWDAQNGSRTIGVFGGRELLSVNDSNFAVGNIRGGPNGASGFVHKIDSGETIRVSDLITPGAIGFSTAMHIAANGVVTGQAWDGVRTAAYIWREGEGFTFMEGLDGGRTDDVHPQGVNSARSAVGWARNAAGQWRAFIWDPANGMRDLNTLASGAPADFRMERALAISETGVIVGDGKIGPGFGLFRAWRLRPEPASTCPGDANGDGVVNFADLNAVLSQFGQSGTGLAGDVNGDGSVTFSDLNIVLGYFGATC